MLLNLSPLGMKTLRVSVAGFEILFEGIVVNSLEHQIGKLLRERGLKLSLAESCTGGLLGDRITNLPGSSEYFWGSLVTYAYEAKAALLNVSWELC